MRVVVLAVLLWGPFQGESAPAGELLLAVDPAGSEITFVLKTTWHKISGSRRLFLGGPKAFTAYSWWMPQPGGSSCSLWIRTAL